MTNYAKSYSACPQTWRCGREIWWAGLRDLMSEFWHPFSWPFKELLLWTPCNRSTKEAPGRTWRRGARASLHRDSPCSTSFRLFLCRPPARGPQRKNLKQLEKGLPWQNVDYDSPSSPIVSYSPAGNTYSLWASVCVETCGWGSYLSLKTCVYAVYVCLSGGNRETHIALRYTM